MPESSLTTRDRAVLLALLAEARQLTNPELQAVAGLRLHGVDRRRLNELGLVDSVKVGATYAHQLTERGRDWCATELTATRPPRAGALGGALYAVLAGLGRYLERRGSRLGEVFAPDVEALILAAYDDLADAAGDWVMLADVRQRLDGTAKVDVDEALVRLARRPGVHLVPEANQQALSPAERAAAVRLGGQDRHALAVEADGQAQ